MILTSPAAVGLLRAIVDDPADDVPRLLLADVLDEAGDPRAEFIRCQIELAGMTGVDPACRKKWPFGRHSSTCGEVPCAECWPGRDTLRRRERELLDEYGFDWFGQFTRIAGVDEGRGPDRNAWNFRSLGGTLGGCHFRRGFVASVTLTCADWCGVVCPVCSGWRSREAHCNHCHGTGRTGRHGPALVLAAPIERVNIVSVHDGRGEDMSAINNLLRGIREWVDPGAVSNALLTWARQEAGLPALTG